MRDVNPKSSSRTNGQECNTPFARANSAKSSLEMGSLPVRSYDSEYLILPAAARVCSARTENEYSQVTSSAVSLCAPGRQSTSITAANGPNILGSQAAEISVRRMFFNSTRRAIRPTAARSTALSKVIAPIPALHCGHCYTPTNVGNIAVPAVVAGTSFLGGNSIQFQSI